MRAIGSLARNEKKHEMKEYLQFSRYIDGDHPLVARKAAELAQGGESDEDIAQRCFEFVRDKIRHSVDFQDTRVTCSASEALTYGTGFCYAKSHLLAALLRANGIPAGLCYQRLSFHDGGAPYCLHGLNAVYLKQHGWYRLDARGNKPGVAAMFCPPQEKLAFPIREAEERDFPEIWAEPLPIVVEALTTRATVVNVTENLPDIPVIRASAA